MEYDFSVARSGSEWLGVAQSGFLGKATVAHFLFREVARQWHGSGIQWPGVARQWLLENVMWLSVVRSDSTVAFSDSEWLDSGFWKT